MSAKLGSSAAFPVHSTHAFFNGKVVAVHEQGMTLRQWYAGKALEGAIAYYGQSEDLEERSEMAQLCVLHVDALLNELEKEVKP